MQQVRNIHHAHVGRTYKVVLADDNLPVLEPVETRGRPRGLSGEQVIAARALRNCGRTEEFIAATHRPWPVRTLYECQQ